MFNCIKYICCVFLIQIGSSGSSSVNAEKIHLEKLSTAFLPYRYENSVGQYRYPSGAAEQLAYDSTHQHVYVVGGSLLHILDINNVSSPSIIHWKQFGDVDLTDVEFCGHHLFVAVDDKDDKENGHVNVYRKYSTTTRTLELVNTITVGALPDMLYPTSDCLTVVVAVEAEPYFNGSRFIDPEGAVGIITFTSDTGVDGAYQYTKLDFRKFNDRWQELVSRGARFIYRENNNLFSNDVEPEYITFDKNESIAYVALQEANAVAEVDIAAKNITHIHPLGFKDWAHFNVDVSDKDQIINLSPWPVMGMYQPDAIKVIYVKGKPYLVTANEGDSKDYSDIPGSEGFNEESRVSDLTINATSELMRWAVRNGLNDSLTTDGNLGRLKVSNLEGKSGDGYCTLYAFGGRSISVFDLNTFEQVYDSGSEIEKMVAKEATELFNSNGKDGDKTVSATKDSRSDDKGPEAESLAVAEFGGVIVLFIGLERPGLIAVYSIRDDVSSIQFESLYFGITRTNDTYSNLYDQRELSEVDPEDIRYISSKESSNRQHLLISTGTESGTVSIFTIKGLKEEENVSNAGIPVNGHVARCYIGLMLLLGTLLVSLLCVP